MPRKTKGRRLFAEEHLARRIAMERERRGMNYDSLSKRTEDAGCKIHASALWKIEKGDPPRRITVDELVVLARVFDLPMAELVTDPDVLLPGHLTELAERAAMAYLAVYQLSQEADAQASVAGELMAELRKGLADRPDLADHVAERLETAHPEWAVGQEEHGLARMVIDGVLGAAGIAGPEGAETRG